MVYGLNRMEAPPSAEGEVGKGYNINPSLTLP